MKCCSQDSWYPGHSLPWDIAELWCSRHPVLCPRVEYCQYAEIVWSTTPQNPQNCSWAQTDLSPASSQLWWLKLRWSQQLQAPTQSLPGNLYQNFRLGYKQCNFLLFVWFFLFSHSSDDWIMNLSTHLDLELLHMATVHLKCCFHLSITSNLLTSSATDRIRQFWHLQGLFIVWLRLSLI